jgi:Restriction endonuclease
MPSLTTIQYPKPTDDVEFQDMIRDLFAQHWKDDNASVYGRSGQSQNGVDVVGSPNKSEQVYGIQCKLRKEKLLTQKDIENEIKLAKGFKPKLHSYIFATTTERDKNLQDFIKKISDEEKQNGGFEIQIKFWDDITSLFAEYPRIAQKYYPQFWGEKKNLRLDYAIYEEHPTEISEKSPLLVGCLLDLSKSMVTDTISGMSKPVKLDYFIQQLVFRISAFCKSEEAEEVLDKLYLFLYGYGFGNFKKQTFKILESFGISSNKNTSSFISTDKIRNIFGETALRHSLPMTPSLSALNRNWSFYQKSIDGQLLDIGLKGSSLYEGLTTVKKEFEKLLQRSFYKYPLLFVITNGHFDDATAEDLLRVTAELKAMNVQIACILVDKFDILDKHTLYEQENRNWTKEVQLLFKLSSEFQKTSRFYSQILESAQKSNWVVSRAPKLFFQLNQTEMIHELIDMIFSPLNDD